MAEDEGEGGKLLSDAHAPPYGQGAVVKKIFSKLV
jgi:hypothetical protein